MTARLAIILAVVLSSLGGAAAEDGRLSGAALVEALRQGGYSIYFRHAATEWSQSDRVEEPGDWKSCDPARVRQLSDEGRQVARAVGAAIRALGIPVGRVLSSEYCRSAETARLLGLGPVETTAELMNTRAARFFGGREAVAERARQVLSRPPAPGSNTVMVAHGNLMRAAAGVSLGEAGAGVFKARADGGFDLVAQLSPDDWLALAGKAAPAR